MDWSEPITFRPSLWAALDITAKILGAITAFLLPVMVPAIIEGRAGLGLAALLGFEAIGFYPAIIAAFIPAVQLAFTRYIIDEDGMGVHVQVLSKSEKRVGWEKVTALHQRRTVIDVLLGLHRLDVVAYGARGTTLHLVGLRDPGPLRDHIAQQMRRAATVDALLGSD